jgi:hypothetical protein
MGLAVVRVNEANERLLVSRDAAGRLDERKRHDQGRQQGQGEWHYLTLIVTAAAALVAAPRATL